MGSFFFEKEKAVPGVYLCLCLLVMYTYMYMYTVAQWVRASVKNTEGHGSNSARVNSFFFENDYLG